MSGAIEALTAAIEANTEIHKKVLAALQKAGGASTSSTASAGTKPAGDKPKKGPTVEDIQAAFGDYLSVTDKAELKERKANVAKINNHFEVERITKADPSKFKEALALLKKFIDGEDPFEEEGDGDDEGSPI